MMPFFLPSPKQASVGGGRSTFRSPYSPTLFCSPTLREQIRMLKAKFISPIFSIHTAALIFLSF